MPTDIWKIPLDSDGCVRGSYYLRHRAHVTDTLGTVPFQDGRSVEPITGRQLVSFVAALGADVDLEPADDAARAAMGVQAQPEPTPAAPVVPAAPVPEPEAERADTGPAPAPAAEPEPSPEPQPVSAQRGKHKGR